MRWRGTHCLIIFFCLIATPVWSGRGGTPWMEALPTSVYRTLESYANRLSATELRLILNRVIDPKGRLTPFLRIHSDSVEIVDPPESDNVLAKIPLAESPTRFDKIFSRGLEGMKIVLDPGHFGGSWAEIEGKQVRKNKKRPWLREGDLNWATALLLQRKLEDAGAHVTFTRAKPPTVPFTSFKDPYYNPILESAVWLGEMIDNPRFVAMKRRYPDATSTKFFENEKRIAREKSNGFALYNYHHLRASSEVSEKFDADLTLSIHYNTSAKFKDINYTLVFVAGDLDATRVGTQSERFYWIRHALDGRTFATINLAREVAKGMKRKLGITPKLMQTKGETTLAPAQPSNWLPLDASNGVYANDYAFLRRVRGPALLIEGPFLDNPIEYERMLKKEIEVDGKLYPVRCEEYAQGVFEGLVNHLTQPSPSS
jgi:N-acetylmuramoyl-L-alanine amidase